MRGARLAHPSASSNLLRVFPLTIAGWCIDKFYPLVGLHIVFPFFSLIVQHVGKRIAKI